MNSNTNQKQMNYSEINKMINFELPKEKKELKKKYLENSKEQMFLDWLENVNCEIDWQPLIKNWDEECGQYEDYLEFRDEYMEIIMDFND